jgi:hypothetical protein
MQSACATRWVLRGSGVEANYAVHELGQPARRPGERNLGLGEVGEAGEAGCEIWALGLGGAGTWTRKMARPPAEQVTSFR